MPQSDPSKTEQATPKQRDKAREKGNVPCSQELSKVTVLLGGFLALLLMIQIMVNQMQGLFVWAFNDHLLTDFTPEAVYLLFQTVSWRIALMVLPVMFTCALIALLTARLQSDTSGH